MKKAQKVLTCVLWPPCHGSGTHLWWCVERGHWVGTESLSGYCPNFSFLLEVKWNKLSFYTCLFEFLVADIGIYKYIAQHNKGTYGALKYDFCFITIHTFVSQLMVGRIANLFFKQYAHSFPVKIRRLELWECMWTILVSWVTRGFRYERQWVNLLPILRTFRDSIKRIIKFLLTYINTVKSSLAVSKKEEYQLR